MEAKELTPKEQEPTSQVAKELTKALAAEQVDQYIPQASIKFSNYHSTKPQATEGSTGTTKTNSDSTTTKPTEIRK